MKRLATVAMGLVLASCGVDEKIGSVSNAVTQPDPPTISSTASFSHAVSPDPASLQLCGGVAPQPACATPTATPVQVRWGVPLDPRNKSGLGYAVTAPQAVPLDTPFVLGSLTHFNFPTNAGTAASAVQLDLTVQVVPAAGGAPLFDGTIDVHLAIDETPNATPCAYPSDPGNPCADAIGLSNSAARTFSTHAGGFVYELEVLGFRTSPAGGTPLLQFVSQENGTTTGYLVGQFRIYCEDADADGTCDLDDNCVGTANGDQADSDADGQGDACDSCAHDAANDADGDGQCGDVDNCPAVANADQADADGDGQGDACDACPHDAANDADGDGHCADVDNCPTVANESQADSDGDGQGDACDVCPLDPANDIDHDGVCGNVDNCPFLGNSDQLNRDGDAAGDACDVCPLDAADDADHDGLCGNVDNCATLTNADQADADHDGIGDVCDDDDDNDGIDDGDDSCPGTVAGPVDIHGCSVDQVCPCNNPAWHNHGDYVSCVAHETNDMLAQGRITLAQKGQIQSAAGQSTCGRHP